MATIKQGIAVVNFEVYVSGTTRLIGIANVELPTVEMETADMKGNGIEGTITMPVRANNASLELKLTWRTFERQAVGLFGHKAIDLSLYSVQEHINASTGALSDPQHKIETRVVPKTLNMGKWEPSSTTDSENTFEIITLNYAIDGKEVLDIDKLNYVFKVNGTDYAKPVRTGLGLN